MDTVSHGLWPYLFFYNHKRRLWALVIGMLPDVVAFVPHFLVEHFSGGQVLFDAVYRLTHSLIIFAFVFCLIFVITRSVPWIAGAWGLHIIFDIFTHPASYYPTPYLYPFDSPFLFALDFRQPWFYVVNYTVLLCACLILFVIHKYHSKLSNER